MKGNEMLRRAVLIGSAALALVGTCLSAAYSQSIKDRVLSEGKITIGIENQAPWGFKAEDGTVAGVHPDMLKAVLEPLGVKQVDYVIMDWGALIPNLISRRIDAIAAGMAITPVRCEQVIFSDPDLAIGDGVMVLTGNPHNIHSYEDIAKNPDLIIGGARGSVNPENAVKAGIPKERVLLFDTVQGSVAALLAGRIHADTESTATVINTLKDPALKGKLERATPFKGLVENGQEVKNYAAIVFRPEDAELRNLYNESLAKQKAEGTVKKIFAKYGFTDAEIAPADVTAKSICPDNYR
ncbi:ectoine/hydroxyectoine ABC transporter substrate-binding protein EhuB [Mesorhizobium sp. LNHC209A00]|uniref:ectoine/hydroxyectoine ABC transporter substrate-binding protein EhuB n=1 Tax=Mesorhizobium TaxID=68287 RepID=UPI0004CE511D|nr:ectoine/hydroxyectoine ABC transporter substrate-binding protein EhuB [Mesorhizobium sp. LNHC209A00]